MYMNEVLKIKEEINQKIKGLTSEEILIYFKKSGEEFNRQMDEYKLKWAEEKKKKLVINQ